MSFGKYRLKSPGVSRSLGKARDRYNRLCGEVVIVKKGDPEKLKAYRKRQRENKWKSL